MLQKLSPFKSKECRKRCNTDTQTLNGDAHRERGTHTHDATECNQKEKNKSSSNFVPKKNQCIKEDFWGQSRCS